MILEILDAAKEEIEQAFLFYGSQKPDLGSHFFDAVEQGYHHVLSNPEAWPLLRRKEPPLRRYLLKRFPFGLIYGTRKNKITVVAVMHLSRKPGYWKKRDH